MQTAANGPARGVHDIALTTRFFLDDNIDYTNTRRPSYQFTLNYSRSNAHSTSPRIYASKLVCDNAATGAHKSCVESHNNHTRRKARRAQASCPSSHETHNKTDQEGHCSFAKL